VVDRSIGRLLAALDQRDLRSSTVIVRTSDHGELGLSHGGLRQKMFNAYEEALRVPLVVSGPGIPAGSSPALVSLVDLVPTLVGLAGGSCSGELDGFDLGPLLAGSGSSVRDAVLFTYDDHQAGTAFQEAPGQPNRIRCVRDARWKYAVYLDPRGRVGSEYELYDLESDPDEAVNLADRHSGEGRTAAARAELPRLRAKLEELCDATGTPLWATAPAARGQRASSAG